MAIDRKLAGAARVIQTSGAMRRPQAGAAGRELRDLPILITGAAGFIGFHVAGLLLDRGEQVVGIDDLNGYYSPGLKTDRLAELARRHADAFRFVRVDFADHEALDEALRGADFDRIVHLGAQAGVRHSMSDPRAYVRANVLGHLNVLEVARARTVAHMVYASSSSVYGDDAAIPFSVEARVDRPISFYAATKRSDELISESYAHLYRVPLTGLRFFTVYGPWGRPDMAVWLFTDAIMARRPIRVFNRGEVSRDFTYIDDVAAAIVSCLDAPPRDDGAAKPGGGVSPHAVYNLGAGHPEPIDRLIDVIEQACGRKALRVLAPAQPGDAGATFADIAETTRDFGFRPATTIEVGVGRFVDWRRRYRPDA